MNELLTAKMIAEFQTLDHDGKGYLTGADYRMRAQRIIDYFGVDANCPQASRLTHEYQRLWTSLHAGADSNHDDHVDQDEFVTTVVDVMVRPGIFEMSMSGVIEAIFDVCDMDGDGHILITDVVSFLSAINVCTRNAVTTFRLMDRDANGYVDKAEFRTIIKELYCSTDPTAPGSLLLAGRCPTPTPAPQ